ncbi:MAG: DUF1778 domain-containing protein [Proteobacteria bacterium]|nr:DUF1778 domain-containing protein [Pseudomonadota bacterium]
MSPRRKRLAMRRPGTADSFDAFSFSWQLSRRQNSRIHTSASRYARALIRLQANPEELELIDRAAKSRNMTRSDFMLEAALETAREVNSRARVLKRRHGYVSAGHPRCTKMPNATTSAIDKVFVAGTMVRAKVSLPPHQELFV